MRRLIVGDIVCVNDCVFSEWDYEGCENYGGIGIIVRVDYSLKYSFVFFGATPIPFRNEYIIYIDNDLVLLSKVICDEDLI